MPRVTASYPKLCASSITSHASRDPAVEVGALGSRSLLRYIVPVCDCFNSHGARHGYYSLPSKTADNNAAAEPMMEMNMTPMIDVMLVLIIMFITTLPIAQTQ